MSCFVCFCWVCSFFFLRGCKKTRLCAANVEFSSSHSIGYRNLRGATSVSSSLLSGAIYFSPFYWGRVPLERPAAKKGCPFLPWKSTGHLHLSKSKAELRSLTGTSHSKKLPTEARAVRPDVSLAALSQEMARARQSFHLLPFAQHLVVFLLGFKGNPVTGHIFSFFQGGLSK